jgi:hypothetical protein
MARGGRRQPPRDRELIPIGSIFGAREFAHHYPDEMMRLGCLTAFWSVVEDQFCMILGMLLQNARKAEAAYYSTVNFKARCDLVRAISAQCNLDNRAKEYLNGALDVLSDAADARNNLMHGLFKMEPYSGALVLSVSDPGTGMSDEVRGKAFEPFFTTKEMGKGSGLGLSMVLGVARQSGGNVRITSRSVKGTSIEVYLPRADSRVSSDGKAASPSIVSDHVVFVADGNGVPVVTRMRRRRSKPHRRARAAASDVIEGKAPNAGC